MGETSSLMLMVLFFLETSKTAVSWRDIRKMSANTASCKSINYNLIIKSLYFDVVCTLDNLTHTLHCVLESFATLEDCAKRFSIASLNRPLKLVGIIPIQDSNDYSIFRFLLSFVLSNVILEIALYLFYIFFIEISIFKFDTVNVHISTRYWLIHIEERKDAMCHNFCRGIRTSLRIYFDSIKFNDNRCVWIENRREVNRFIPKYDFLSERSG